MSETVPGYRWSASEFVRAYDAGAFDHRVELVDGEVWPVIIGTWHGRTVASLIRRLSDLPGVVSTSTLPSGESFPDPDCWVSRVGAEPVGQVGIRLDRWAADDVLLVVEVSDETVMADLTTKAMIYGSAGYSVYWVITPEVVYVHTQPHPQGYRSRLEYRPGDHLPVPHHDTAIDVTALLAP